MSIEQRNEAIKSEGLYFLKAFSAMMDRLSPASRVRLDETPTYLAVLQKSMYELAGKSTTELMGNPPSLQSILQDMSEEELERVKSSEGFIPMLAGLLEQYSGEHLQKRGL